MSRKVIRKYTLYLQKMFILFAVFLFTGCSKYSLENRINLAQELAQKSHFKSRNIETDSFILKTYTKVQDNKLPLKIYIEGDGFAWINRYTLSSNPTPINPVALKLATLDTYKNIAYVARPCQYVSTKNCSKEYWSNKRFSQDVIHSMNQAITIIKKQTRSEKIELVGFSGGAAISLLIASQRDDVQKITTIAGNLNHALLHEHHGIPPLRDSLNPIDIASKISHIKQIHFIGGKDEVIPPKIAYSFRKASNNNSNIKIVILPNATHVKNWESILTR